MREKWSEEELKILKASDGKTLEEASSLLPKRTKNSIENKGNKIGLKFKRPTFILNPEELNRFILVYPLHKTKQLQKMFPQLKKRQMELLAYRLKLTKDREKESLQCSTCENVYPNTDEYFNSYEDTTQCKNCRKRKIAIYEYKTKYGIELDFYQMFNTYSPIEWHNFLFSAPNSKKLSQLPFEIRTIENFRTISRHVFIENGLIKREQILKTKQAFLQKHKIFFKINGKQLELFELLSIVFPELSILPWEVTRLPKSYFENEVNVFCALEWIVDKYNFTKDDILDGCINQDIIRGNGLRMILENFGSFAKIIIFYFKCKFNLDISEEDIYAHRKLLSQDNKTVFDSIQERLVFDYIKFSLNHVDLRVVRKSSEYRFYNSKFDEAYYPDFVLPFNDQEFIIEYYGMFQEKPKTKMYVDYKSKIGRKNDHYNRHNLLFIDLYPKDLENDFLGIKNKIEKALMQG